MAISLYNTPTTDLSKIGKDLTNTSLLPTTLNSKNTAPSTVVSTTPKVDNTNYSGMLAAAQQQALQIQQSIANLGQTQKTPDTQTTNPNANYFNQQTTQPGGFDIQSYIDQISGVQPPSVTQTYQQSYNNSNLSKLQSDVNAKSAVTAEAQGRLNNISAQLQALNAEAQAVPIQIQQDSEGRGRTASGIAPLQADALRKIALRALPLQAAAAVIQGEVASAQNNQKLAADLYSQAEDKFNQLFKLQMEDANRKYDFQVGLINKVYEFADTQQQRQLQAIQKQQEQAFKAQQDAIDYQRQVNLIKLRQQATPVEPPTTPQQIANLKLTTTQKSDLVDIQTLEEQLNKIQAYASDGTLEGVGSFGVGSLKSTAYKLFGSGSAEGADVRTLIGNLKGQIAKLRGGTSFTANEEKLLDSYVPGINESTASILAKVKGLQEFLASKKNAIIQIGGGLPVSSANDPLGIL